LGNTSNWTLGEFGIGNDSRTNYTTELYNGSVGKAVENVFHDRIKYWGQGIFLLLTMFLVYVRSGTAITPSVVGIIGAAALSWHGQLEPLLETPILIVILLSIAGLLYSAVKGR